MSSSSSPALPRIDRLLLRWVGYVVPSADRGEWTRSWQAELWWRRHPVTSGKPSAFLTDLSLGLCRDALWLRLTNWDRILRGTAALCLLLLLSCCSGAGLLALCLYDGWPGFDGKVSAQYIWFLCSAPLVLFVTFSTATRSPINLGHDRSPWGGLKRKSFLVAKLSLLFILAYLLSMDLCAPLASRFPNTGDSLQVLLFVLISVLGLRWAFQDQDFRCKTCLRLLNEPTRIGRPSHNLLIWSGTELVCREGHGLLNIPELETSWHQSSEWLSDAKALAS